MGGVQPSKASAERLGDHALRWAWLSLPVSLVLVFAAYRVGGWAGGGRVPLGAYVTVLPGAVTGLLGLAALALGLRYLEPRGILAGLLAMVSGAGQAFVLLVVLAFSAISWVRGAWGRN